MELHMELHFGLHMKLHMEPHMELLMELHMKLHSWWENGIQEYWNHIQREMGFPYGIFDKNNEQHVQAVKEAANTGLGTRRQGGRSPM